MRKNPFSIYDFLGYVFPGAFALMLICFFVKLGNIHSISEIYTNIEGSLSNVNSPGTLENGSSATAFFFMEQTIIWTITAYIVGHIIAYLSSLTVEKFSIWTYGYPSEFLLHEVPPKHYMNVNLDSRKSCHKKFEEWIELIWRLAVGIFLFPISLCTIVFGKFLGMKAFFVKPLDKTLKSIIENNIDKLKDSLGVPRNNNDILDNTKNHDDFHRIIYHYEYERQNNHMQKMDNYVALYGFLRAMTFISNCVTLWIIIRYACLNISIKSQIDWHLVLLVILCIFITYIFFMSFMKFYRRFTLESYMCLVIDSSFKEVLKIPYNYNITHLQDSNNAYIQMPIENTSTLNT